MDFFPLPIFPEGSLRESVVTTVWVGVWVISFFNLRFGWSYSGLVIPGYLVPLLLINPLSGFITMGEGILAYLLVRFVSEHLSRFGWWCNFFGRDRFFALFISAVLVRVTMDGWCLPALAGWLRSAWNLTFDYQGSFHSFGMIIMALIANQFWKTGLWRGLMPFSTSLILSFVLIRFVLMTLTNFNVGHMSYMYANTAASLLASPKSYIILIVTGFVASRMNLRYGWEYNGILIPALLALQWYEPLKIVSSLAEAGVVYVVSDYLLRLPVFRGVTMEGARKLLLFFNVAYAYRLALGFVLPVLIPGAVVNDYYGFAYLLSSLIALKMHSKHIVLRLTRATLQTSFFAAVAANLLGLWVASLFGSVAIKARESAPVTSRMASISGSLETVAAREKIRLYRKRVPESVSLPGPGELNRFQEALVMIQRYTDTRDERRLAIARRFLSEIQLEAVLVEESWLCLREAEPSRGWGLYLINLERPRGLLLEIPAPLEEWAAMEAGVQLCRKLDASLLAVSGSGRFSNQDGASDVLNNPNSPFQVFHKIFARANVLQVRGYAPGTISRMPVTADESSLWVKNELPPSLPLRSLREQAGSFSVHWQPAPLPNVQQRRTSRGFAELWLTEAAGIQLKAEFARALPLGSAPIIPEGTPILEWLLSQKRSIARAGSNQYLPPTPEEMRFLDEEVLTPLLELAARAQPAGRTAPKDQALLSALDRSARLLGYSVSAYPDPGLRREFVLLAEAPEPGPKRYWGTLVLSLGETRPYVVQVPRPLSDLHCLEYGVDLFHRLNARALLLAGSHNEANQDGVSDVLDFRNTANLFSLVNQVIMRQARDEPRMAIQCRAYAAAPAGRDIPDVLLALQEGIRSEAMLGPLSRALVTRLKEDALRVQFVDGSPSSAGYEVSSVPQAQYLNATEGKEFAVIWLSSAVRDAYRSEDMDSPLLAHFKALAIPVTQGSLESSVAARLASGLRTCIPTELKELLEQYVATTDIVVLKRALVRYPAFEYSGLLDRQTQRLFLLVAKDPSAVPVAVNLRPRCSPFGPGTLPDERDRVRDFLCRRSGWLEWQL